MYILHTELTKKYDTFYERQTNKLSFSNIL